MSQNPYVKKVHRKIINNCSFSSTHLQARRALEDAKIEFKYLEYGSYFSQWSERLAIKYFKFIKFYSRIGRMWSGWATFPQVYVNGTLLGGFDDTVAALKDGTFESLLNAKNSKTEESKVTLED